MPACHKCNGSGKLDIVSHTYADGKCSTERFKLTCIDCNGSGQLTEIQLAMAKREDAMWCRCKNSPGASYVPDSPSMKHHWVCNHCGKVTQIG